MNKEQQKFQRIAQIMGIAGIEWDHENGHLIFHIRGLVVVVVEINWQEQSLNLVKGQRHLPPHFLLERGHLPALAIPIFFPNEPGAQLEDN